MRKRVFKRKKKILAAAFAAAAVLLLGGAMTVYGQENGNASSGTLKTVATDIFHRHIGSPDTGGGCYTRPIEHKHQGDAAAGGGCYTKVAATI